jgi:hypothetical protein
MKRQILLLAIIAAAISSCTTAYRTGQTPDDVYYSPTRPQDEYVREEENNTDQYRVDDEYYDDRYLRMKVQNHTRWDYLDDWYAYDRYSYRYDSYYYGGAGIGFYGNYWNPYTSWNYYYNPYCSRSTVIVIPAKGAYATNNTVVPRNFNLNSYTNNQYSNQNNNYKVNIRAGVSSGRPVYNNNNSGLSNTIKQIFSGVNTNGYNNSSGGSSRTYSPSSSGSSSGGGSGSSSGSSSGGGGGVSRPARGSN